MEIPHKESPQICLPVTRSKAYQEMLVAAPTPRHDRLSQREEKLPKPDYTSRKGVGVCPLMWEKTAYRTLTE